MATITDDFNRADANPVSAGSFSWTMVVGAAQILSNVIRGIAGTTCHARAESSLATANHYAQAAFQNLGGGIGMCVRFSPSAETFYMLHWDGSSTRFFKIVAGSLTVIGSVTNFSGVVGSVLRVEVNGSNLEAFQDGVSLGTATDADITGNLRTGFRTEALNDSWDDFEAGDLSEGHPARKRFGAVGFVGGVKTIGSNIFRTAAGPLVPQGA